MLIECEIVVIRKGETLKGLNETFPYTMYLVLRIGAALVL